MADAKNNTKLMVSGVMIASLLGKLLGFIKELILAYYFGASDISDAYLVSQTIPGTLFMVIGTGISTCYVPIYIKTRSELGRRKSDEFTDKFITIIVLVTLLLTLLIEVVPGVFVRVFAVGFDRKTLLLASQFTRINGISLILSGFLYCYSALLQSEKKYYHVSVSNIPYNVVLILAIIAGAYISIYALSIVSVLAVVIQLGYQLIFVREIPYSYRPNFHFKDLLLKQSLGLLPPVLIGVAAAEINTLIDRTLASNIQIGGITVITYGTSLFNLIIGVFSNSISAVYYPNIAESVARNDHEQFRKNVEDAIYLALFFLLPCTIGAIILREPIVKLLFGHGEFGASHVKQLSSVFACYSIGFIPFAVKQILNNVYYSHQKTKTPMINTTISVLVNITLNILLSRIFGLSGLAIATGIASIIATIILVYCCKKDYGIVIFERDKILRLLPSTICVGFACYFIYKLFGDGILVTILTICVSVVMYFALTAFFGISPIEFHIFKRRFPDDRHK